MIKVGVVGATGYAGEEVIKILINHKGVKITELSAVIDKEEPISTLLPIFKGKLDCICKKPNAEMAKNVDLVFLGLPHKVSMDIAPAFLKAGKLVVDLSADYRLDPKIYEKWYGIAHKDTANLPQAVYGLPELYRDQIKKAKLLANPGCYPTSVILGVAPALSENIIEQAGIIADSKSGATGAGRKADIGLIFCEVNENLKAYKVNDHQHKPEINAILSRVAGKDIDIVFTPHLIPMNRGILSTIYMKLTKSLDTKAVVDLYKKFYDGKPFVRVHDEGKLPQVRDVVGTNYCDIGIKVTGSTLIVVSCIDNLKKGAAGQAVQNMNIMCGFEETEALS
jgi:N-acetyl-gamma-glutamyl-phosphate reductase